MKIGLVDADMLANPRTNQPKVDLMKLGVYYQKNGHQVETLHEKSIPYDYDMLCIFSDHHNIQPKFLKHPNINMYGEYFTNKNYVPFNNKEIDYEKANYKIYDNLLRYDFLSKKIDEQRIQKIKNTKWVRLFPEKNSIDIYELLTGEYIQLADTYIFDKNNWREVVKKLAIYAPRISFSRPQIIKNQDDFDDFMFLNKYKFSNCKGLILTNNFSDFKKLIIDNQEQIKNNATKFIYNIAYDCNNFYNEMFYLEEIENNFNKAKLLSKLGIVVTNLDMICYSNKPLTLSIYNTFYMWMNSSICSSMNFYRYYYFRYKKYPHLIKYFNDFINKYPKYSKLFSCSINEEE